MKFETTIPKILNPQSRHKIFASPAEEFELQEYDLSKDETITIKTSTAEIFLLMNGMAEVITKEKMELKTGDSIFVKAGTDMTIQPLSQINLFRATVPQ